MYKTTERLFVGNSVILNSHRETLDNPGLTLVSPSTLMASMLVQESFL